MVEREFTVVVPLSASSSPAQMAVEMSRALSVWLHRDVDVVPSETSRSDGK